ncbi:MAG: nucleotide exchange factor GrpE [Elusimicrobiota bacterium]
MTKKENKTEEDKKDRNSAELKKLGKELGTLKSELKESKDTEDLYLDQLKRLKAEFDNYRKRMQKQSEENLKTGEKRLAKEILSVMDNLHRAMDHRHIDLESLSLIRKELFSILARKGMKEMESEGLKFDHNCHHAVGFCEVDSSSEDECVKEVLQRGYFWDDEVLRPAMVVVGKLKEEPEKEDDEPEPGSDTAETEEEKSEDKEE